jgi:tryptophan-rich sensory protein
MNPHRPEPFALSPEVLVSSQLHSKRGAMGVWSAAALAIGALVLVSLAGAFFMPGAWYESLVRPSFTPPNWVFGPVWTVMYTLNAIALFLLLRAPRGPVRNAALTAMGVQLALNALWTPVYFGAESLVGGLVVISALLVAIVFAIASASRAHRWASWLLLPYLAWVSYAAALNAAFWWLNR